MKIIKDGTLDGNIDTLPTAVTSLTRVITVALSADEMNADRVAVLFHDAAGSEWQDSLVSIYTSGQTLDTTDGVVDGISAVKPDNKPTVAATGEASANVTFSAGVAVTSRLAQASDIPAAGPTAVQIRQEMDSNSTQLASILEDTGTTLPATLDQMMDNGTAAFDRTTDSLQAIRDRGDVAWTPEPSGIYSETITVQDGDGDPLDGAFIQMATDSAYSNVIRSGYTNNLGQWVFQCDATGTYYGRAELAGKNVGTFTVTIS